MFSLRRHSLARSLAVFSSVSALVASTDGAIIASTDFDDTVKSGSSQTMTGVDWTGDDLVSVTPATAIETVASANAGYFTSGFGATGFAPDQNIENEGPWTATIQLTFNNGATGTLAGVAFDYAGLTNSGDTQGSNFRAQNFDIAVNGNPFDTQKLTTAVNGSISFTDTAALNTGLNLITITSSEVDGPGYNMAIDNLVFSGTVVPEPGVFALLGVAGLTLLRRRRAAWCGDREIAG